MARTQAGPYFKLAASKNQVCNKGIQWVCRCLETKMPYVSNPGGHAHGGKSVRARGGGTARIHKGAMFEMLGVYSTMIGPGMRVLPSKEGRGSTSRDGRLLPLVTRAAASRTAWKKSSARDRSSAPKDRAPGDGAEGGDRHSCRGHPPTQNQKTEYGSVQLCTLFSSSEVVQISFLKLCL